MRPMGPISQMAMRGDAIPMPGLASIQKLTNGFVVSYDKAMEVIPPVHRAHAVMPPGFQKGIDIIARAAAAKLNEGEEWRQEQDEDEKPPQPVWVVEAMQIVCKTEDEMIEALREAVKESAKIEVLYREGKLGGGASGNYVIGG